MIRYNLTAAVFTNFSTASPAKSAGKSTSWLTGTRSTEASVVRQKFQWLVVPCWHGASGSVCCGDSAVGG